ncbi:MAG: hypothetical protein FWE27_09865 [Defluviitaleaceae bacterium]|nr:hypothetical protein [Defluviitaleaceae bacterium]
MYPILFGIGAGFILLSLFIGEIGDVGELELGDVDGGSVFSFLKPSIIAACMVVMGGVGMILTPYMIGGGGIVLFISALSGLAIGGLLNRFILIPLRRAFNTSAFNKQDTIGVVAEVVSPILKGGYGKIRYNISGSYVTSPAKSEDGNEIKCGENVEIIYIEQNTYFVRRQFDEAIPN